MMLCMRRAWGARVCSVARVCEYEYLPTLTASVQLAQEAGVPAHRLRLHAVCSAGNFTCINNLNNFRVFSSEFIIVSLDKGFFLKVFMLYHYH